jgi:hypothetical protein
MKQEETRIQPQEKCNKIRVPQNNLVELSKPVFRIRDILVLILVRRSVPLTIGSGSGSSSRSCILVRRSVPLTIGSGSGSGSGSSSRSCSSSVTFKTPAKNNSFFTFYFLKIHLHHFSKIKKYRIKNFTRNQGFSSYFFLIMEGSGSVRPKHLWIQNSAQNKYYFCKNFHGNSK